MTILHKGCHRPTDGRTADGQRVQMKLGEEGSEGSTVDPETLVGAFKSERSDYRQSSHG